MPHYIVKTDGPAAGKGVLVTDSWEEAAAEIKAKLEQGGAVLVSMPDGRYLHDMLPMRAALSHDT